MKTINQVFQWSFACKYFSLSYSSLPLAIRIQNKKQSSGISLKTILHQGQAAASTEKRKPEPLSVSIN